MDRNWGNQKTNPALKTKTGNKQILQITKPKFLAQGIEGSTSEKVSLESLGNYR